MTNKDKSLGFNRDMCALVFGADSKATEYMDSLIEKDPDGRDGQLICAESQLIYLLSEIHNKG